MCPPAPRSYFELPVIAWSGLWTAPLRRASSSWAVPPGARRSSNPFGTTTTDAWRPRASHRARAGAAPPRLEIGDAPLLHLAIELLDRPMAVHTGREPARRGSTAERP